jgi:hypothetical protein
MAKYRINSRINRKDFDGPQKNTLEEAVAAFAFKWLRLPEPVMIFGFTVASKQEGSTEWGLEPEMWKKAETLLREAGVDLTEYPNAYAG